MISAWSIWLAAALLAWVLWFFADEISVKAQTAFGEAMVVCFVISAVVLLLVGAL